MKESDIERKIREYAESKGLLFKKFTGIAGWPDRILLSDTGATAFLEIKKPGGDVAPKQVRVCKMLRARGFPADIVDSIAEGKRFIDLWILDAKAERREFLSGGFTE
jgi:hypothetical protein